MDTITAELGAVVDGRFDGRWSFWAGLTDHQPLTTFKKRRSLQFRFFDPTPSERFSTLPVSKHQLEGATSCRGFVPAARIGDWLLPIRSSLLEQRTKLLTPSVAHLPVFKVA